MGKPMMSLQMKDAARPGGQTLGHAAAWTGSESTGLGKVASLTGHMFYDTSFCVSRWGLDPGPPTCKASLYL